MMRGTRLRRSRRRNLQRAGFVTEFVLYGRKCADTLTSLLHWQCPQVVCVCDNCNLDKLYFNLFSFFTSSALQCCKQSPVAAASQQKAVPRFACSFEGRFHFAGSVNSGM